MYFSLTTILVQGCHCGFLGVETPPT